MWWWLGRDGAAGCRDRDQAEGGRNEGKGKTWVRDQGEAKLGLRREGQMNRQTEVGDGDLGWTELCNARACERWADRGQ